MNYEAVIEKQFEKEREQARALLEEMGLSPEDAEKTAREFVSVNTSFIHEHGFNLDDVKIYLKTKQEIEDEARANAGKIIPGDVLQIHSNNGYVFYNRAHVEESWTDDGEELHYCEQPYSPWYVRKGKFSTSGGAWGLVKKSDCEFVGTESKIFNVWSHTGATANGALRVPAVVNVYKTIINREFVPLWVGTYNEKIGDGYKYWVNRLHKNDCGFHCYQAAFRTMKGLKRYLRDRHLRIGKKWGVGTSHAIIGDFNYEQFMSRKEYDAERRNFPEFPLISNGTYTAAFYKEGKVYFCNPNVRDRKTYAYFHE